MIDVKQFPAITFQNLYYEYFWFYNKHNFVLSTLCRFLLANSLNASIVELYQTVLWMPTMSPYSNETYKKIIDDSLDGFFVLDRDYCVMQCNRSFQEMLGSLLGKTANRRITEIFIGESRKRFEEKAGEAFRKKMSQAIDVELENESGMVRYYLVSLNPLLDLEGRVHSLYGFLKDITEMKRLQNLIEKERNYNRSVIETVNLGFVLVDDWNEYLDYNKAYLEILGRDEYELVGKNFYDFTAPEYRQFQEKIMEDVRKTGKTITFDKEYIRKDGSKVPVQVTISRLFDKKGKLMGSFAFIKDISEQKRIERELVEKNERIMKLIEIYGTVSAKLLSTASVKDVYRLVTEAALEIMGPSAIEIFAAGSRGFRSVYSHNVKGRKRGFFIREEQCPLLRTIIENPNPFFVSNTKRDFALKDLKFFPQLKKNASAIFVPVSIGGEVKGFMVISFEEVLEDIDRIVLTLLSGMANLASLSIEKIISQRDQTAMKQALDRYERLTAMGRIIAGVAHEINNPLSIMQLDLDDLKHHLVENESRDDELREIINSLQEEIARMSGIIAQLKDFSKPEMIEENPRVPIDEVIKSYPLKILLKNLKKKGITVKTDLGSDNRHARISKNRLLQVLMNLISNADDALVGKDGGVIEIETRCAEKQGPQIAIIVRDNGIGIEEDNISKIFEPFYTTKKAEGTGLGLSISYSIIKSCNGEIEVKSQKGAGTEFVVYLPLADEDIR